MEKRILGLVGVAVVATAAAAALLMGRAPESGPPPTAPAPKAGKPTLYCEFYNFVGRAPKVGFTFATGEGASGPAFTQVSQFEMDGTRAEFEPGAAPAWAFDGSDSPPTLTSPDGAIRINLYGYEAGKQAAAWFEAGLRSVQYLNLDGKCRRGAV